MKPEVEADFKAGLLPADVLKKRPEMPRGTVYLWYQACQNGSDSISDSASKTISINGFSSSESLESPQDIATLYPDACSSPRDEVRMLKREIWRHIKRPGDKSAIAIQGANAYLRAIQIEHSLPASFDDEPMPNDERAARVARLLESARTRRDRQSSTG